MTAGLMTIEAPKKSKNQRTTVKLQLPSNSQTAVVLQSNYSEKKVKKKGLLQPCSFGKGGATQLFQPIIIQLQSKEKVKDKDKERFYTIFPKWIQCNGKDENNINSNYFGLNLC